MSDEATPEAPQSQENTTATEETGGKKGMPPWGVAVVAVLAVAALFWPADDGPKPAPDGMLYDSTDHEIFLSKRLEHVTLIHFWATWCGPCIDEIPRIRQVAADYSDDPNFAVVMVAVADDKDKIREMFGPVVEETLYDPDWDVTKRYGTRKLPETHLVVAGEIVDSFIGPQDWNRVQVRRRIDAALLTAGTP